MAEVTPEERADLTESMVPEACNLAVLVHDADQEGVAAMLARFGLTVPEDASPDDDASRLAALLVVTAAMVPVDDRSPADLLAWEASVPEAVKWRQLPLAPYGLEPCPSLAAYRRHQRRGEDTTACGCEEAARAQWREKARRQKERRQGEVPGVAA